MHSLLSIFAIFAALCLVGVYGASNSPAQAKCRSLHHQDAEPSSQYSFWGCSLRCMIHDMVLWHDLNENQPCPLSSSGTCKSGECMQEGKLGHIDVEIVSASLSRRANAYTIVCIQNSTTRLTLPVSNRRSCVSCASNPVMNSSNPQWNSVCANSAQHLFVPESRVTVEVWDIHVKGKAYNIFLGGTSLTIAQLLSHGNSHKVLRLSLTGGTVLGQLNVRITWTPTYQ